MCKHNTNIKQYDGNKGGKFLKELWCCVDGESNREFSIIDSVDNTK